MIKRLLILNGLSILGAVLYHTAGWGYTALFWWTDRYLPVSVPNFDQLGSFGYYSLRVIEQLVAFSVPSFLFVSGYFVAFASGKNQSTISWDVVIKRLKGLLPPFVIWSMVFVLFYAIQGQFRSPVELVVDIVTGQISPAYYYIPVLVQLYVLSPFLVSFARKNWKAVLWITGGIQLIVMGLRYLLIFRIDNPILDVVMVLTRSWMFPAYIFWFTLGSVTALHLSSFKIWLQKVKWVLLVAALVLFIAGMIEWELLLRASNQGWIGTRETLLDNFYIAGALLTYLAFDRVKIPGSAVLGQLGARSYGIYLTHLLVMEITARLVYHLFPGLLAYLWVLMPIVLAAGLGVPLVMMEVLNRLPVRRYYDYVFG